MQFFRLASILGLVSIAVLNHTSVMAEQQEAETGGDEELRKALAVLDSTTDMRSRILVSQTFLRYAKCLGFLGTNGEFIIRWRHPRQPHEGALKAPFHFPPNVGRAMRLDPFWYSRTRSGFSPAKRIAFHKRSCGSQAM